MAQYGEPWDPQNRKAERRGLNPEQISALPAVHYAAQPPRHRLHSSLASCLRLKCLMEWEQYLQCTLAEISLFRQQMFNVPYAKALADCLVLLHTGQ